MDQLVASHNQEAITELKAVFGLESLKDIRDFAMTIAFPSKLVVPLTFLCSFANAKTSGWTNGVYFWNRIE